MKRPRTLNARFVDTIATAKVATATDTSTSHGL